MQQIIDSHQHFWHFDSGEFEWISDSMIILRQDYLPLNLKREIKQNGVEGTVAIQARQSLEETRWLLELANKNNFIKGVVGWVDLRSDELVRQLDEFSAEPKFKGVRHVIHDEADDGFMLKKEFIGGISQLAKYNLSYDLLLFPRHLRNAARLVAQFPDQRFVIDHLAKPYIKKREVEPWREDISKLAAFSNVWCKISGMVTEANHHEWELSDFVPYIDVVMNAFGTERVMLGSDWPVCRLAAEYSEVMKLAKDYFEGYSENEKSKIFRENSIDFYRLKV